MTKTLVCSRCDEVKPDSEFHRNSRNTARRGRNYYCKACNNAYQSERYAKMPHLFRQAVIKNKYGLILEAYAELLSRQGGHCALCDATEGDGRGTPLHVDHDHETGRVRGLLCGNCNRALGLMQDSVERVMSFAAYLIQHEAINALV